MDFTAKRSGYYRVFVDSVQVSQHTSEREAQQKCTEVIDLENSVYYDHDYEVEVTINTQDEIMKSIAGTLTHPDSTPASISGQFNDEFDVTASSTRTSNAVTITEVDSFAEVSITVTGDGGYRLNGAAATTAPGIGSLDDTIQLEHTASGTPSGQANTSLILDGTVSDTFTSTTQAAVGTSDVSIAFSDFISGPKTGIGDPAVFATTGSDDGTAVTIWGFGFGASEDVITFTDANSNVFTNTANDIHVYYWKNADGTLPGGPSDLYNSHGMGEIMFCIPSGAVDGIGSIRVTVAGETSDPVPFLVRTGSLYHVGDTGQATPSDGGPGTWAAPFASYDVIDGQNEQGAIFYMHNINELNTGSGVVVGFSGSGTDLHCDTTNQMGISEYPHPTLRGNVEGNWAFRCTNIEGFVFSKMRITLVERNSKDDGGFDCTNDGRIVGCFVDHDPAQIVQDGNSGAFKSGRPEGRDPGIDNTKVLGNYAYRFGDSGTTRLNHVTYFKVTEAAGGVQPKDFEVSYNHFKECGAQNGIHFHHSISNTKGLSGNTIISNNVIVDQGGNGISILPQDPEYTCDWHVYNNVVINAGGQTGGGDPRWGSGMSMEGSHTGDHFVYNNVFWTWDPDDKPGGNNGGLDFDLGAGASGTSTFTDNIFYTIEDKQFFYNDSGNGNLIGEGNAFIYKGGGTPTEAIVPTSGSNYTFTNNITDDSGVEISRNGSILTIVNNAAIANQSSSGLARDIYGALRTSPHNTGAIG